MSTSNSRTVVLIATHAALFWGGYRFATRQGTHEMPPVATNPEPAAIPELARTNPVPATAQGRSGKSRPGGMSPFSDLLQSLSRDLETMDSAQLIKALAGLQDQPPGVERLLSQQLMMTRLAQIDPLMALSYAGALSEDQRRTSESTVLGTWTKTAPVGAAAYFTQHADDFGLLDAGQRGAAETIAAQWAQTNPTAALQWAQGLPEEVRADAMAPIITRLSAQNPDRAIAVINASAEGSQRTEMLQSLVTERGRLAPQETADWVRGIPDAQDQGNAAASLVNSWMQTDIASAAEWVKSLGEGPVRDAAVRTLLESPQLRQSPELAALWASSIEDDALREQVFNIIAVRWDVLGPQ